MTRYTVVLATAAARELVEILQYLENDATPGASTLWIEQYERLLESLKDMPRRFPLAREAEGVHPASLRQARVYSHRVLFTIESSTVRILHIRHYAQDDLSDI